jgi:hypothetical protein
MSYDPREKKLPKWAQEMLAHERVSADLRWPSEPEPKPIAVLSGDSYPPESIRGRTVYKVYGGYHGAYVDAVSIGADGYVRCEMQAYGSRPHGTFYATRNEALLAAWWRECKASAAVIHKAAQAFREATS